MKKWIFIFGLLLILQNARCQELMLFGVKVNPAFGIVHSKRLNDNFEFQKTQDSNVTNFTASSRHRFNFGVGVFGEYAFNDQLSVLAEPTFNFLRSRILLNYHRVDLDSIGNGSGTRISSDNYISLIHVNLAITAKYKVGMMRRFYFIGGPSISITSRPKIKTSEIIYETDYVAGMVEKTEETPSSAKATIDKFSKFRIGVLIGGGKKFMLLRRDLYLDIRYTIFFNNSEMYTEDRKFDESTLLAGAFSQSGKEALEETAPGKKIDGFKLGTLSLSFTYTLFAK